MKRMWALAGAALVAVAAAQERARPSDGLYFFLAPTSPGIDRIAPALAGTAVRPVLLVDDLRAPLPDEFLAAVKALGREMPVIDEEGLALARAFGITRTPCLVRVVRGRAHVACGSQIDVKEVLRCSR
jgi:hypothetical protein